MSYLCVSCGKEVGRRQEALQCDTCDLWQHRKCNSGVSRPVYRRLVRGEIDIGDWNCSQCSTPVDRRQSFSPRPVPSLLAPEEDDAMRHVPDNNDMPDVEDEIEEAQEEIEEAQEEVEETQEEEMEQDEEEIEEEEMEQDEEEIEEAQEEDGMDDDDVRRRSFKATGPKGHVPAGRRDDSVHEPLPDQVMPDVPIAFEVILGGAAGGGKLLADNHGFTYSKKRVTSVGTTWICSKKKLKCGATVKQIGDDFLRGPRDHNHPSNPDRAPISKARALVKEAATTEFYKGAGELVEDTLRGLDEEVPLPAQRSLARTANRARAALRPKHPTDLDFELDMTQVPDGFLKRDIAIDGQRHLIFATDLQLQHLADAFTWYMDGTFKVARAPFTQMFSIHSFIHSGGAMKQVPLCFVMMSRRRTMDYHAVFDAILDMLPRPPRIDEAVLDFEKAVWSVLTTLLPDVQIYGCWFHWAQAVYRKLCKAGLQTAYSNQPGVRKYLKQLMALPNLPPGHIVESFYKLKDRCPVHATSDMIDLLLEYLEKTWITNPHCPPTSWTTFRRAVRTNNDVEGWHARLNKKVKTDHPNLYCALDFLYKEATYLPIQVRLVCQQKISRVTSQIAASKQANLEKLWDQYDEMSTSAYLRACAELSDHSER